MSKDDLTLAFWDMCKNHNAIGFQIRVFDPNKGVWEYSRLFNELSPDMLDFALQDGRIALEREYDVRRED